MFIESHDIMKYNPGGGEVILYFSAWKILIASLMARIEQTMQKLKFLKLGNSAFCSHFDLTIFMDVEKCSSWGILASGISFFG